MEYKTKYQSIVFMGKIASGKGTQANEIISSFGGTLYSNGNKVRETAQVDSVLGRKIKEEYESGRLIPEWIASYWMTHALIAQHPSDRVVFEAVAKKPNEAELFHEIHQWIGRPYIVFNLEVSDDLVRERSAARSRDVVDSKKSVEKRLEEYELFTQQSIDYFRSVGTLVDIDGGRSLEMVRDEIFSHLINS